MEEDLQKRYAELHGTIYKYLGLYIQLLGLRKMKYLLTILIFGITTSLYAKTLSFPYFKIEVLPGWYQNIDIEAPTHHGLEERISLSRTNGAGILKMGSYDALRIVNKDTLRNMTNVEISKSLTWQDWGDYSGYQYSYIESGKFYRQWWLASGEILLFITYSCDPELKDIETEEINEMVNSLTVNKS